MLNYCLNQILENQNLTIQESKEAMDEIMSGKASEAKIAAYLIALRMKGETVDEITGSALSMREKCLKLDTKFDTMDIVGTGGDKSFSFNISTIASFVVSAYGIKVSKHGNRSVSSKCGAADVLEALGVNLNIDIEKNLKVLEKINLCFMFAQKHHEAMKYAAPVRKELGQRTIFNILGPLANPAFANYQMLGVYSKELVEPLANVLKNLGVKRGLVVYGDGLDEITLCGTTHIAEIKNDEIKCYDFDPRDYGFELAESKDLVGGNPEENAKIVLNILNGEKGPKRDVVVLNAALCIYMHEDNLTINDAIEIANQLIDSKKALHQLKELIRLTGE